MRIVCFVNNYQYGESRFKNIKEQYGYDEELLGKRHHLVWMDAPLDVCNFLKSLLNNDYHDNVHTASGFSRRGWIEMYKQRLESNECL